MEMRWCTPPFKMVVHSIQNSLFSVLLSGYLPLLRQWVAVSVTVMHDADINYCKPTWWVYITHDFNWST